MNTSRSGRSTALERALDKAIAIPASRIEERVARMRRDRPGADAAELVEMAGARFRRDAGLSSGAVGASAAIPAISTGAAAALTVGQSAAFIASAVTYVLTVAEIQGSTSSTPSAVGPWSSPPSWARRDPRRFRASWVCPRCSGRLSCSCRCPCRR